MNRRVAGPVALFVFLSRENDLPGYKVVVVFVSPAGAVTGMEDFITGWLTDTMRVLGRPVGVAVAADGSIFVSDDTGYVFRVRYGS